MIRWKKLFCPTLLNVPVYTVFVYKILRNSNARNTRYVSVRKFWFLNVELHKNSGTKKTTEKSRQKIDENRIEVVNVDMGMKVVISLLIVSFGYKEMLSCPVECRCMGLSVSCSPNVTHFPQGIPNTTEILRIRTYSNIKRLSKSDFEVSFGVGDLGMTDFLKEI